MIGYYAIVAVLLIYSNSTDAGKWFDNDIHDVKNELLMEVKSCIGTSFSSSSSSPGNGEDILCEFDNDAKEDICNEVRNIIVEKYHRGEFESFVAGDSISSTSELYGSGNPYECQPRRIEDLGMTKRMYWCNAKQFRKRKRDSKEYGVMKGFFCAGSLRIPGTLYVFRPSTEGSAEVSLLGAYHYSPVYTPKK